MKIWHRDNKCNLYDFFPINYQDYHIYFIARYVLSITNDT